MSTVCSGAAILSAVKIKVPPRLHRPNRKTYRPMPIFEKCQISALAIYGQTLIYTHNCTTPPCCPSHSGSSSRAGVLLPEGSRTSAKLQSHSHPQTWSTRGERKLQHNFTKTQHISYRHFIKHIQFQKNTLKTN